MNYRISFEPQDMNNCPPQGFRLWAKSRGGTLVTCAYNLLRTVLTVQTYSQYTRKNLDLLEQGPRGIGR